jgi:hypothetical protein
MGWLSNIKEILGIFAPLLIELSFDMQHAARCLRTPFIVELGFNRIGQLN